MAGHSGLEPNEFTWTHLSVEPIGRYELGDSHFVGSQSPRLIRTDDVAATWPRKMSELMGERSRHHQLSALRNTQVELSLHQEARSVQFVRIQPAEQKLLTKVLPKV